MRWSRTTFTGTISWRFEEIDGNHLGWATLTQNGNRIKAQLWLTDDPDAMPQIEILYPSWNKAIADVTRAWL